MTTDDMLEQALKLDPARRFELAEGILHSLDQPDPAIDAVWIDEAESRLCAYRAGKVEEIPIEDALEKKQCGCCSRTRHVWSSKPRRMTTTGSCQGWARNCARKSAKP